MAQIQGTVLAAKISPGDTSATFPTHEDIYGKGGLMSVQTLSELATGILQDRQKVGMMIFVSDTSQYYAVSSISYPLTSYTPASRIVREYTHTNFVPITGGTITGSLSVNNDVTIFGNLTAKGTTTFSNTIFATTSALSVIHIGNDEPALYVAANGTGDLASFYDYDTGVEMFHIGGADGSHPNIGIKTSTPDKALTVNGEISANNLIYDGVGNSSLWNSVYTTVNATSSKWVDVYNTQAYTIISLSSVKPVEGENDIVNSLHSNIAGGNNNLIEYADWSVIGGGIWNSLSGMFNTIPGGAYNSIYGKYSSILGGTANINPSENAHIIGSNITATLSNYTYVNNISSQGIVESSTGTSDQWSEAYNVVSTLSADWINNVTGRTIYIDSTTGTDTRTNLSIYDESKPFQTLSAAIAASSRFDSVRVRSGSYFINQPIALNNKSDNIFFEPGTNITIGDTPAFIAPGGAEWKYILGHGRFIAQNTNSCILSGASGPSSFQLPRVFECNRIESSVSNTLFSLANGGVFRIKADLIFADNSTVLNLSGLIPMNVDFKATDVICLQFVKQDNTNGSLNAYCDYLLSRNVGIEIIAGNSYFNIANHASNGENPVLFNYANGDNTAYTTIFDGGSIVVNNSDNACITFAPTTATNKKVILKGDIGLQPRTTGSYSISSADARDVLVTHAHSTKPVTPNITMRGGSFVVDPIFQ
jgi:hypothetical protein